MRAKFFLLGNMVLWFFIGAAIAWVYARFVHIDNTVCLSIGAISALAVGYVGGIVKILRQ